MLKELTEFESKVYNIFRRYKSAYRAEAMHREGITEEKVKEVYVSLEEKGYLSSNKLGHYKETVEAQKARLGGLTSKQYVAESEARMRAKNAEAFEKAFRNS